MNRKVSLGLHAIGVALLLVLAWTGITGGIGQLSGMHTTAQGIQTVTQIAFGVTSVLALITMFRGERWRRAANVAFVATTTAAAGLAPYAWGKQGLGSSLAAAMGALLICWLIVWMVRPRSVVA